MTAVSRMFNGSTFNFASSAVGKIIGISYSEGGTWVDVTQPEDLNKLSELSTQADLIVKLKFKGGNSLVRAAKGVAAIVWKDGTTTACPGTWQVGPREVTGDWDAPITSTAELKPTVPDAT
jgi:hypothetical protein